MIGVYLVYKKRFFIALLVLVMAAMACTMPTQPQADTEAPLDPVSDYPDSPEGVVREFLIAYQEGESSLARYVLGVSDDREAVDLLGINGMVMSFLIQSASVQPDPPAAVIEVGINLGEEETIRVFNLTKADGAWMIVSIEKFSS